VVAPGWSEVGLRAEGKRVWVDPEVDVLEPELEPELEVELEVGVEVELG